MKKILITGASRGIGLAIARALKPISEKTYLVASKFESFESIKSEFENAEFFSADFSKREEVEKLIQELSVKIDCLDVLVNNAGVFIAKNFEDLSEEDVVLSTSVNFKSQFMLTQKMVPFLKKSQNAQIINISSIAAKEQKSKNTIYAASKAAMTAFSNSLRAEMNVLGIKVTTIHPRSVNTWGDTNPDTILKPEDVANLVNFIANTNQTFQIEDLTISNPLEWKRR